MKKLSIFYFSKYILYKFNLINVNTYSDIITAIISKIIIINIYTYKFNFI